MKDSHDTRKVWGAFVKIAMSARRRGWTEMQFTTEVWATGTRNIRGDRVFGHWPLTVQLLTCVKGNKKRAQRDIDRAWAAAGTNLGPLTAEQFVTAALDNATAWLQRLDENLDGLSATQTLVMRFVCEAVLKRRSAKVTAPCREVGSAAGLSYRTANFVLNQLARQGFLVKHDGGRHSDNPSLRRAAIYSLGEIPE